MVTVAASNIKPLGDRVLVRPIEREERTKGGIVLPDTAKEKPQTGKVLAAGSGRWEDDKRVPLEVKPGDTILYARYGGTEIKVDGDEELLILSERDILAVVAE